MAMEKTGETVLCRCEICGKMFRVERAILSSGPAGTLANEFVFDGAVLMPKTGQRVSLEFVTAVRLKTGDMCQACARDFVKTFVDILKDAPARRKLKCKDLLKTERLES